MSREGKTDFDRTMLVHGGVKVRVEGRNIERFLNIAAQRGLFVRNVESRADVKDDGNQAKEDHEEHAENRESGVATFWTTPKDFKRMKPVAKKTETRLRIKGRSGLPFLLYRNRKRKLLAAGIGSFFLLLYIMSFYIWDISFVGNHRFTDEMLLHYMETIAVVHGMKKSDISCDQLEAGIRNAFTEITWVSAEIRGTRLMIHVKENEAILAPVSQENSACDLTAEKSGKIVRTVVRSGFCQVKEGDAVEAGALLVDGTVPIYDDSGTLVTSHEVHADAEIFAETVHTIQKSVPYTETIKARTGKTRGGIFIKVLDRIFYFMLPALGDFKWEYIMEQTQVKILEDFYLPVYIGTICAHEYTEYEKNCTEKEVIAISEAYLQEYMEKLQEKGIQILGSDGKIEQSESGWQIVGTLTVIEDIAKETPTMPETKPEN